MEKQVQQVGEAEREVTSSKYQVVRKSSGTMSNYRTAALYFKPSTFLISAEYC